MPPIRRLNVPIAAVVAMCWLLTTSSTAAAGSVTVAAGGDIAKANSPGTAQRQTAALISDLIEPARVLMLGDAQYERGEYSQFLNSYDRTWGGFKQMTAPVPGNHEYETSGASGYFRYFANVLDGYGSTATDPQKGYYAFDLGDWKIVALNTNCSAPGVSCTSQRAWLNDTLATDGHSCELVFAHQQSESFARVLAAHDVELFVVSHRHTYERWDRAYGLPVRQLVVGTGGKSITEPRANADAGVRAFGVAKLRLDSSGYAWSFIDVAGRVRDSGSGTCRTSGATDRHDHPGTR